MEVGEHIRLIYVQYRKIPDRISEIIFFPRFNLKIIFMYSIIVAFV